MTAKLKASRSGVLVLRPSHADTREFDNDGTGLQMAGMAVDGDERTLAVRVWKAECGGVSHVCSKVFERLLAIVVVRAPVVVLPHGEVVDSEDPVDTVYGTSSALAQHTVCTIIRDLLADFRDVSV